MSVVLGARDAATGRRMAQYLDRASTQGGRVGAVEKSRLPVPQFNTFGGDGEYTGGFRLVDMSETTTENGEGEKETEKVIPKLGVLGTDVSAESKYGILYFSMGATIYTMSGFVVDLSDVTSSGEHFIYAYWIGDSGNVLVTKDESANEVAGIGSGLYIPIGSYSLDSSGQIEIKQLFRGDIVNFVYRQPFLARVTGGDPVSGFNATLYSYPTPDDLRDTESVQGKVFLSECCLDESYSLTANCFITVHPVACQIVEASIE